MSANTGRITVSRTATSSKVKLGEVEDLNPKFVKMDVPKRPLNDGSELKESKKGATEAKSKKIGGKLRLRSAKRGDTKTRNDINANTESNKAQSTYAVPRSPFINQDKVAKRPLSRNARYVSDRKATAVTSQMIDKKAGRKTTTIIDKPEKDSKMGMVVAIILTIILGAVAGTVAFLLLPK
jgi:hypothetical protein